MSIQRLQAQQGALPFKPSPVGLGWLGLLIRVVLPLVTALSPLQGQTLAMRHFDNRDGLPQSQVNALLEDRNGFIWVSTGDGLVRLGANETQVFDGTNGLSGKDVSDLMEDREGAVWVATEERGLARIRGREVAVFGPAQGLLEEKLHCLLQTRKGELYAGSQHGLYRRRGERFEAVPLPGTWAWDPITGLAEDPDGSLWLGSRRGALAHWDGTRLEPAPGMPREARTGAILRLRSDPSGRVWALQAGRILRLDPGGTWSVAPLSGLPGTAVLTGLSIDRTGALIVALGTDGIYVREPDGTGRVLPPRDLPCRDSINVALRDRNGGLWLGTDGDHLWGQACLGLRALTRNPDTGTDLGLGTVSGFLERPGQRMLVASNNGLFLWAEGRGLVRHWSRGDGLASQDVWALHDDGQGGAWIGTMKGLFHLGATGAIRPGPSALARFHIQSLARQGGRLWAGTDHGLAELGEDGRFVQLLDPADLAGFSAVHCLVATEDGLLLGTGQGLLRFSHGRFTVPFGDDPSRRLQILSLQQDAGQRLWVGTSQGLQVRDPASGAWSSRALEANGMPIYAITWIRTLPGGAVAIGHAKGVTLVDPAGRAFHLTRRMGLISDETNQDAALVDRQGRLWIGMVGGLCRLDDLKALPPAPAPIPVILDLAWEHGHFWLPERLTLPPGTRAFSVEVDAGTPNTPFPVRYEVRFEDAETAWHPLDPGRGSIYFEGLSHGHHRLRFRIGLEGGQWRESAPLDLMLRPAWYQTLWAWAALAILGALALLGLLRLRTRHLQRRNLELELRVQRRTLDLHRSAQELTQKNHSLEWTQRTLRETLDSRMLMINTVSHDLRSPLTSILLTGEQIFEAAGQAPEVPAGILKKIGIMAHEAHRLDGIVKGLLDQNRAESLADRISLEPARPRDILENLEDTLTLKGEARGLRTHLALDPASLEAELLLDVTAIQQVLFNLLENALKFTDPPGDIGVRSSLQGAHWALEIWDTGRGLPPEACERLFDSFQQAQENDAKRGWGLGLYICRSIVTAHRGTIAVDSEPGRGSTFKVLLPLA